VRALALLALTLVGCASMHGPLDVITPDEFTLGQGSTVMDGGIFDNYGVHDFGFDAESESTYAALTWDIPSFQDEGLTTEERRAIRDFYAMVDAEEEEVEAADTKPKLLDGANPPPPAWLPFTLIGVGLVIVLGFALYSRRREQW